MESDLVVIAEEKVDVKEHAREETIRILEKKNKNLQNLLSKEQKTHNELKEKVDSFEKIQIDNYKTISELIGFQGDITRLLKSDYSNEKKYAQSLKDTFYNENYWRKYSIEKDEIITKLKSDVKSLTKERGIILNDVEMVQMYKKQQGQNDEKAEYDKLAKIEDEIKKKFITEIQQLKDELEFLKEQLSKQAKKYSELPGVLNSNFEKIKNFNSEKVKLRKELESELKVTTSEINQHNQKEMEILRKNMDSKLIHKHNELLKVQEDNTTIIKNKTAEIKKLKEEILQYHEMTGSLSENIRGVLESTKKKNIGSFLNTSFMQIKELLDKNNELMPNKGNSNFPCLTKIIEETKNFKSNNTLINNLTKNNKSKTQPILLNEIIDMDENTLMSPKSKMLANPNSSFIHEKEVFSSCKVSFYNSQNMAEFSHEKLYSIIFDYQDKILRFDKVFIDISFENKRMSEELVKFQNDIIKTKARLEELHKMNQQFKIVVDSKDRQLEKSLMSKNPKVKTTMETTMSIIPGFSRPQSALTNNMRSNSTSRLIGNSRPISASILKV